MTKKPGAKSAQANGDGQRRVLIIEDEMMVAMMIEDVLTDNGFVISALATDIDQAMGLIRAGNFDAAVLDLNLGGAQTFPLADELMKRAQPFIFSTGYGAAGVGPAYQSISVVQKPFEEQDLVTALNEAMAERASS
jgi:DNA-binding NtrC family response regulator